MRKIPLTNLVSKENFGKGRTAADIRENAKKVHGGKAENYSYFDLGEAVAVGESLVDLSERYKIYSERIVNKYHKSKEISEEILALAKETGICLYNVQDITVIMS